MICNRHFFLFFALLLSITSSCQKEASLLETETETQTVETAIVDFEPDLLLVQTYVFHYEKQHSDSAYISVQLEQNPSDWTLRFTSSEVQLLEFVELDQYTASLNWVLDGEELTVQFFDIEAIEEILNSTEQLMSVLKFEL